MKKIGLIFLVIALLLAVGCSDENITEKKITEKKINEDEIAYIEFRVSSSLKSSYLLDEKLNLADIFIVVKLKGNKGERVVSVTKDMIVGFDTSTTTSGREMYAVYKNKETTPWIYSVQNPQKIETEARFDMNTVANEGGTRVNVVLDLKDLSGIYALQFDLGYAEIYELSTIVVNVEGWDYALHKHTNVNEKAFTLIYYATKNAEPITQNGRILSVDFKGWGAANEFKLTLISVADGEKEYSIPDVKHTT